MGLFQRRKSSAGTRRLWLDLGDLRALIKRRGKQEQWQDHGLGLLRTILHQHGLMTDLASTRACTTWEQVRRKLAGYDMLIMNVRSYTFPLAYRSAKIFKGLNPKGLVLTGGMHATVALNEMLDVPEFDKICQGPGEEIIVDLVRDPGSFPRVIQGRGAKSMADWPMIDRTLWPRPASWKLKRKYNWPLEPKCGWGPPPVATIMTSRVCPWQCVFCNENSYIPNMGRRPVDMVIDELNYLDRKYGIGSVVIHDSLSADTRVFVDGLGLARIGDLRPTALLSLGGDQHVGECGLWVATDEGLKCASFWTDEGVSETLTVELRNGIEVTMTRGHRVRVIRDERYEWSRVEDLKVGDWVPVQSGMDAWGPQQIASASYLRTHATWSRVESAQVPIDDGFGWLLGFFLGDGTMSARRGAWFLSWACNTEALADRVQQECMRLFGKHTRRYRQGKIEIVHLTSKLVVRLFQQATGSGERKKLAVPEPIFRSPRSVADAFVRGLHDADGYRAVGGQSESISTISKELAQGVALLLLNMGRNPVIYTRRQDRRSKGYARHPIFYTLYVHKTRDSVPVLRDISWRKGHVTWGRSLRRTTSRATLAVLDPEHDLLRRTQFFVPITSICRGPTQRVYDLTVPDGESFVANGLISHNSMFFQNPPWLEEWLDKYPRKANRIWPYWAAARADTVRQWPQLFESLVRETRWDPVSIGFESGSDRVLRILNKECTEEDNYFAIDLLTRIGDDMESQGKKPPVFFSNIMLAIPGETREDAFKTMRMVKYTKRIIPSIAYYAPYPGSALGHQLIAEGRSLMSKEHYHRFRGDEKVRGIDYQFYNDLLAGKYEAEVVGGLAEIRQSRKNYTEALNKA